MRRPSRPEELLGSARCRECRRLIPGNAGRVYLCEDCGPPGQQPDRGYWLAVAWEIIRHVRQSFEGNEYGTAREA